MCKRHTHKAHFSPAGYHFLICRLSHAAAKHGHNFFIDLSKQAGSSKAVVGGPAGPAKAGPLFWPKMVLAGPRFWPNILFAGPFSRVSFRRSFMIYFAMIKD